MNVRDGLSAIAKAVLADVQKEAEDLILTAETDAKKALEASKQKADLNYQAALNNAVTRAEAEKRRIASITEVEMRNFLLQAKEELVDAVFDKALLRLKEFVETEEYHQYLLKLIQKVAKSIEQQSLVIQVNAKDKAWLTQEKVDGISKKLNRELKILAETGDFIGGFKIQTQDGKITFDSTIDTKFNDLKPLLRVELAKMMFKEETNNAR